MHSGLKFRSIVALGGALAVLLGFGMSTEAQARPNYLKEFMGTYEKVEEQAKEVKCGICHPEKSKKVKNSYGKALGGALGEPKVKDADKIIEALKSIESKDSDVEGKTFGDLLEDGKLPN